MSTQETDQTCGVLTEKLSTGLHLTRAEKEHLAQCFECMRKIVFDLDQMAEVSAISGMAGGPADAALQPPNLELLQALENGRRWFLREFGLQQHPGIGGSNGN